MTGSPARFVWPQIPPFVQTGHHYRRAPIVEARLGLSVESDRPREVADFAHLVGEAERYGQRQDVVAVDVPQELPEGERLTLTPALSGYVFVRDDGARRVHVAPYDYEYVAVGPYPGWDHFFDEASLSWGRYARAVGAGRLVRAALRFTNRVLVPKEQFEVKDYLRTAADLSPYLPQAVTRLRLEADVPLVDHDALAKIVTFTATGARPGAAALVLDIEVSRPLDTDLDSVRALDDLRDELGSLREAKNFVFEACITDATRGLID